MMSRSAMRHVHRPSVPAKPVHRPNRCRSLASPVQTGNVGGKSGSPHAAFGLIYGVPMSLTLWAVIGAAMHFG